MTPSVVNRRVRLPKRGVAVLDCAKCRGSSTARRLSTSPSPRASGNGEGSVADSRAQFGAELRRWRTGAGVSLADLAVVVHYSKGYLSKIENGLKRAHPDLARRCDVELRAGGRLASLVKTGEHRTERADEADDGEAWMVNLDGRDGSWFRPMGRREAIVLGAGLGFSVGAPALARSAGGTALSVFRLQFDQMRALGQVASPGAVIPTVIAQTHTLRELARQAVGSDHSELFLLASRSAEYVGWMAQESGDERASLWWTDQAVRMAESGGDRHLARYALVRKAVVALYQEDAGKTIALSREAQAGPTPARIQGLAAQLEAQGHALAGDYESCMRVLDRARSLLVIPDDRGDSALPVLGAMHLEDPVAMAAGWCLLDLGRPREAAAVLDRQLQTVPEHALRTRARYGVRRALAYAMQNEVERACEITAELQGPLQAIGSATVAQDLRRLRRTLARFHGHKSVRNIYPLLTGQLG
ncbi:helix-turn-helix domain-containing protein [Amycolatopsis rubida]|uniref:Helix-turn-helix domain-containing protein n=2 Tax=Pseudonocardiaceae TaxID=2070 RepID=A0ABX0BV86_9PSEU|nr:helix-turn-helix transcriptional regulator [Amycolatopsis rubida]MYW91771.1 helix-turn-helix domain-containing protein [Amycolatopsis rubida]NEC56756.1 helix-turn-helix domain-containing protein [Amycolatopsis rubida]